MVILRQASSCKGRFYCYPQESRQGEQESLLPCRVFITRSKATSVTLIVYVFLCESVENMVDEGGPTIHHDCNPQVSLRFLAGRQLAAGTGEADSGLGVDGTHVVNSGNNREKMLKEITGVSELPDVIPRIVPDCESAHKVSPILQAQVQSPMANRCYIQDHTRFSGRLRDRWDEKFQKSDAVGALLQVGSKYLRSNRCRELGNRGQYLHNRVEEAGVTNVRKSTREEWSWHRLIRTPGSQRLLEARPLITRLLAP
jgi:hypothetical protein